MTLLEISIVILILGILIRIWFFMSYDTIQELHLKNDAAVLQEHYNKHLSTAISTSYFGNKPYDHLKIFLQSWANHVNFSYSGNSQPTQETIEFPTLHMQNFIPQAQSISIYHKALDIWCEIQTDQNEKIQDNLYVYTSNKQRSNTKCFTIDTRTCKLEKIRCADIPKEQ